MFVVRQDLSQAKRRRQQLVNAVALDGAILAEQNYPRVVVRKLSHFLAATATRRACFDLFAAADRCDCDNLASTRCDHCADCSRFGASPFRVRGVLHVTACVNLPGLVQQCGTYPVTRVGRIRVCAYVLGRVNKRLFIDCHGVTSIAVSRALLRVRIARE